ncbi:epoxyqueuosine reductase QueH [Helicobacter sp. 11S03491-1]|uniref:epoxyqueuosine reductase QueH n=1 Tax=Helicobacter sp. 11S03491-1 TaxID=1476196 RepID=UPI000BA76F4E|nr:epoxyqueuosine reductase QueH [Helicobacter sp. 11S03491-1]PAF43004.1 hypothetical protein BKH45_02735 [Helicobacter sp. 11S03491-1]
MLVHICCSVDSHYFLSELQKIYPNEKFIGYFYNPNIHPKSEYNLRLSDVKRSCNMLGIQLIEGEYDTENWFENTKGFEYEPEKGERCTHCFDIRLAKSALIAKTLDEKKFTTTLLSSPMKEQEKLYAQGDVIAKNNDLEFIKINVRANGGTQRQNELAKADNLYRQNYCGCKFALEQQRNKQNRFSLEMISHIGSQILPGSIEERQQVFDRRNDLEKYAKEYILTQRKYILWRLLNAKVQRGEQYIPSYVIAKSQNKKDVRTGPIIWIKPNLFENIPAFYSLQDKIQEYYKKSYFIGYAKKDDTIFVHLKLFNLLLQTSYQTIKEIIYHPPKYNDEIFFRNILCGDDSINPIIIVDEMFVESVRINIQCIFQEEAIFRVIQNL